jgi:pimeloyl-ACP methyl ester carboxylesterase
MRIRDLRGAAAAGAAAVLALSGCALLPRSPGDEPSGGPSSAASTPATPPAGAAALETFYGQRLTWSRCSGGECADLRVPLSYADPERSSIAIKVLRVPASRKGKRLGSLVVNPGGPGGSGVDYARAADYIVGKPVRQRYDIVGFDPRGVGRSAPIDCVGDRELDALLGMDPTPDDEGEQRSFAAGAKSFAESCGANAGPLLAHVSTVDAAKDMDILRAALGEERLHFLGKSYGTFLGATYADLFPSLVGRFVLDGVVAPDLTSAQIALGQAKGFETATRAYVQDCVSEGGCPLGTSVDGAMEALRGVLRGLDGRPARVSDPHVKALTEGWATYGVAQAMYDEGAWGILTDALRELRSTGDGSALMALANQYADRSPDGRYESNIMEVIYAVNCLDSPESADVASYERQAAEFAREAPTWGPLLAWSSMPCGFWPVEGNRKPAPVAAEGSGPIVVVGTTRDPATPYEWSVRLHEQLANSVLVTYEGDGHTAYRRSNDCVDKAIDAYYVKGTVPRDGLRC